MGKYFLILPLLSLIWACHQRPDTVIEIPKPGEIKQISYELLAIGTDSSIVIVHRFTGVQSANITRSK